MTIDKEKLKALVERVTADRRFCADEHHHELATGVSALLAEIERLATSRSKKERELEQELETWHHGPFCWTCGDTGDVHDITGEWRGECDCLSAQLINANRERDQIKAENDALRKDAERYRWLRDQCGVVEYKAIAGSVGRGMLPSGEKLQAAVDAAMAGEASHD